MTNDLDKKIRALLIEYIKTLPGKMKDIQTEWQQFNTNTDKDKLKVIYRNIHALCGTTGSYGLKDLSAISRKATDLLKDILSQNRSITAKEKEEIDSLLIKLNEAISNAVKKN